MTNADLPTDKRHCDILILSRPAIEALAEPQKPCAVISITNTDVDKVNLRRLRNVQDVLRIAFNEITLGRPMPGEFGSLYAPATARCRPI